MKCPKPKIFSVHILDVNFFKRPEGCEGNWKMFTGIFNHKVQQQSDVCKRSDTASSTFSVTF